MPYMSPSGTTAAVEYTPELDDSILAKSLNDISTKETEEIGQARARGVSGGLGDQAATGSEIGQVEAGAVSKTADTIGNFNMDVAGKKYSERMTNEARQWQDTERQKTEDFQKSLTEMGYAEQANQNQFNAGQQQEALHASYRGQLMGLATGLGGAALGGWAGSGFAMGGAGAAGSSIASEAPMSANDSFNYDQMMLSH